MSPCIITKMRVSQFMNIEFVDVELSPGVNPIEGPNRSGKTTFVKAVEWCVGGDLNGHCPEEPIRRGADRAEVVMDVGPYRLTRSRVRGKKSTVVMRDMVKNITLDRPAERLKALVGELTFDPLAFRDQPDKKQIEILRKVYGLEFADLDNARSLAYAERTKVNQAREQANGHLLGVEFHQDAPEAELDFAELTAELNRRHAVKAANDKVWRDASAADAAMTAAGKYVGSMMGEIDRLRTLLQVAEEGYAKAVEQHEKLAEAALTASEAVEALVEPDIQGIQAQIASASKTNREVRENAEYQALSANVESLREESEALTAAIEAIDREKLERLNAAEARCPIPGVGLSGESVTLGGLPLAQASEEEQLTFCLEISAALNPTLQTILIDKGEALDPQSRLRIAQWAADKGLQVIMGVVTDGSPSDAIVLKAGRVLGR